MSAIEVIPASDYSRWTGVLNRMHSYDFYHTASYHQVAQARGEGEPLLFVFCDGVYTVALPLLLRDINGGMKDATSVYGYAGPIASHANMPHEAVQGFQRALSERMRELAVVSVFSRLHPLLSDTSCIAGLGRFRTVGQTVSIDVTKPLEVQRAAYRRRYKSVLNKLRRGGFSLIHDTKGGHIPEFLSLYQETMERVHAGKDYRLDAPYVRHLMEAPESYMHLFLCSKGSTPVSCGLFSAVNGIVQYHLGGTSNAWLRLAPMKLLIDEVRIWASNNGQRVFHLGGGVGSKPDSLFFFKAGFSKTRHPFQVWCWVVMEQAYEEICRSIKAYNDGSDGQNFEDFFPCYRRAEIDGRRLVNASVSPSGSANRTET